MFSKIFSFFGNLYFLSEGEAPGPRESDMGNASTALLEKPGGSDGEKIKTHPAEAEPMPVSDMIFATSQDDKIHDVIFEQGDKKFSLQQIHPVNLTVEITHLTLEEIGEDHGKEAVAHLGSGIIEINDEQPADEDFRLRLLHEWGHLVDYEENLETYSPMISKANFGKFKREVIVTRLDDIDDSKETDFSDTWTAFDEYETKMLPEEREENRAAFTRFLDALHAAKSIDDVAVEWMTANNQLAEIETQLRVKMERDAWAVAIKAVRVMRRQGINPFNGTEKDMLDQVDRSLYKYQKQLKPRMAEKYKFYRKSKPPVEAREVEDIAA